MKKILAGLIVLLLVPLSTAAQEVCEGNFDYDQDVDGSDAFTFKTDFGRSPLSNPCPSSPCPVICEGTLSAAGRWCDQGNGTVKDMITGLVWLQDASCMGPMEWLDAIRQPIINLRSGDCGLTDGSEWGAWRLPTYAELFELASYGNPEYPRDLPGETYFFTGLEGLGWLWTSTTVSDASSHAKAIVISAGLGLNDIEKSNQAIKVWPVRGGH